MYNNPSALTPFIPEYGKDILITKINKLIKSSFELNSVLNNNLKTSVYEIVKHLNGYYSNLIEGNTTIPVEIEDMMHGKISNNKKTEMLLENFSHIILQEKLENYIDSNPNANIMSKEFLLKIHKEFYENMNFDKYLEYLEKHKNEIFLNDLEYENKIKELNNIIKEVNIIIKQPSIYGSFRKNNVKVGTHYAPFYENLDNFVDRLFLEYKMDNNNLVKSILNICAFHHKLLWVHPFEDGNGRVSRLMTHSLLYKIGIIDSGLWSMSRGLARNKDKYYSYLEQADNVRQGDLDGRGNLSDKGLFEFCNFILDIMIDQTNFSKDIFTIDKIEKNYIALINSINHISDKRKDDFMTVIRYILLKGEMSKQKAIEVLSKPDRTVRDIIKSMTENELLYSNHNKDTLKLKITIANCIHLFPDLIKLL